jgi:hypothetical protein
VDTERPAVLLRRYSGPSVESALSTYGRDLRLTAEAGSFPVALTWGWDSTDSAGFLIGASSWKPGPGTLAVTDRPEDPAPQPAGGNA